MAGIEQVSFTDPYAAQALEIERRRRLAEALQQQGAQPLGPTQEISGWAIPRSPLEGAAKLAQSLSGAYGQKQATEQERQLAQKYQDDLTATLTKAATAAAPHAEAVNTSGEGTGSFDMSGTAGPATQTVPGDPKAAMALLMQHPATRPIAMQQLAQALQAQQIDDEMSKYGYGSAPAASSGAPTTPGMSAATSTGAFGTPAFATAPQGAPAAAGGARLPPGVDPVSLALLRAKGDYQGIAKMIQEAAIEQRKPISTRYGVFQYNPATGKYDAVGGAAPPNALNYTFGPNGQVGLGVLPGQLEATTALTGATERGKQPFSMQTMEIPVKLPGGNQVMVKMNAVQAEAYNRTGALPPEIAAGIPGYQPPAATPGPAAAPAALPQPAPGAFPRETPAALANAGSRQLDILNAEARQFTDKGQAVPADLAAEIANAQRRAGGQYPARAAVPPMSGTERPTPGLANTQEEQITQARQTAAGKAVDEQFAKDYVAFTTGGAQDAAKQIAQLQDVKKQLATPGADLTGPFRGSLPDFAQKMTATGRNAIAMRERVEEVVQRSLRAILGAQFTEKEGERLIARAYNPNLSEGENAIRVGRLMTQLEQAYQQKADAVAYFQKNNTLSGWQGKLPSIADFDPEAVTGKIKPPAASGPVAENDPLGIRKR